MQGYDVYLRDDHADVIAEINNFMYMLAYFWPRPVK